MELQQLIYHRKFIIKQLDRLIEYESNDMLDEFEAGYNDLELIRSQFDDTQCEIEKLLISKKSFDESEQEKIRDEFSEKLILVRLKYTKLQKRNSLDESSSHDKSSDSCGSCHKHTKSNVNLPKLPMQIFTGEWSEWQSYVDFFTATILENESLSDIERYQYLRSSVKGEPFHLIKNLPLTKENFPVAWKTLGDYYLDKRRTANKHVDELLDVPPLRNDTDVVGMKRIINVLIENLGALQALGFPTNDWSFLLLNVVLRKLDSETRRRFERSLTNDREFPTYAQFMEFLEREARALDTSRVSARKSVSVSKSKPTHSMATQLSSNDKKQCIVCGPGMFHLLKKCPKFLHLTPFNRMNIIKKNGLCFNCFSDQHGSLNCTLKSLCGKCDKLHNSLLHFSRDRDSMDESKSVSDSVPAKSVNLAVNDEESADGDSDSGATCGPREEQQEVVTLKNSVCVGSSTVLLSTAVVRVRRSDGCYENARVLLDPGSMSSFMTSQLSSRLGLPRRRVCVPVCGLGMSDVGKAKCLVSCDILPTDDDNECFSVPCLVLNKLTNFLPNSVLPRDKWEHLKNLNVADPSFHVPAGVDMLLGAEMFPHILRDGRVVGPDGSPSAINTVFGWLVMGGVSDKSVKQLEKVSLTSVTSEDSLDVVLRKFWEVECEPSLSVPMSADEKRCENIFETGHYRDKSGKYVVRLPFKEDCPKLGESRDIALSRLYSTERRFVRNEMLRKGYCDFLREYLESGHMELIQNPSEYKVKPYYIPHHCVIRESSSTTPIRVVFNGSEKSSNGVSLNETLLPGRKLQQDIEKILLLFRLHGVVFTADIKQMFRGILVHEDDLDYQRILWREHPSQPVQEYRLRTVTYGLTSAPYLAIRTLQQLASDEGSKWPEAASVLVNQVFVDDIVSGASCLKSAEKLKNDLIDLCAAGGFLLRKWASNDPSLLDNIPDCDKETCVSFSSADDGGVIKVLGVKWNPSTDEFQYNITPASPVCTKRAVLSQIAKCFDPMGWLCPVTLFAKCLMQKLWARGLSWDENLPEDLQHIWLQFIQEFPCLSDIKIERFVLEDCVEAELHGFSDSSEQGYAGVVYLRVLKSDGHWKTHLLMSKSRVAPLKRITLPRLELCAAVVVSRLLKYTVSILDTKIKINRVIAWSDSTIALAWIKGMSYEYKTFVANRASECQTNVSPENWYHVPSSQNPADCASRGLLPSQLVKHELWWNGPHWLSLPNEQWPLNTQSSEPQNDDLDTVNSEKRAVQSLTCSYESDNLMNKFSDLTTLLKVTAWCLRFKHNCLNKTSKIKSNFITVDEVDKALTCLIKNVQRDVFGEEIANLEKKKACNSVALQRLKPFVDESGLMRVGGRLPNSKLDFDVKHQVILPKKSPLTNLIIDLYHKIHLHAGAQTVQYLLQQKYWILAARSVIRGRIFRCVTCFRNKPRNVEPEMGNLPSFRVEQCRAFSRVGIDYCGHFMIKMGTKRNPKLYKAYVCLFVCVVTHAIHLELVSDQTAEAFIAALKRFCSRRGLSTDIYCDCGRNFVKANKVLAEFREIFASEQNQKLIQKECVNLKINFHFNPPYASHMSGFWEIQVRCFKHHLKRVVGLQTFTYEEFYTIMCQIESVLNSRPICPLSNDPSDPQALTPGHFLIGQPLVAIPEPDVTDVNTNRLTRWQLLSNVLQHYWKRWSKEYLHTMQQRSKWLKSKDNVKVGSVVVIRDDNLPPLQWRLGVITETHPGNDGVVRVVTVRTAQGVYKRSVVKICPLPDPSSL